MPNEMSQLDQLTFESFFRTTLDEGLTKWKNELNFQTQKMQTMTQNFKTLDGQIETNFESIKNMILYRQRLQNDSEKSLSELKDIILEEDQVLEHLNYLDNTLGNYLEEIDKTNLKAKNQDKESQLYNNIIEVSKSIDSIELVIKDANSKVSLNQIEEKPKEDNNHSTSLIYENERLHEKMPIEKSEMDYILNSFYVSIRAIQSMQQDLNRKILQAESDINEMHKEPYHNKFMKDNYN